MKEGFVSVVVRDGAVSVWATRFDAEMFAQDARGDGQDVNVIHDVEVQSSVHEILRKDEL